MPRFVPTTLLIPLLAACAGAPAPTPELADPQGRRLAELAAAPYDPARHDATCKVYHHVHAPDGRLLTKGVGGEFAHHRGLFVGWNRVRCGDRWLDFWHCRNGERQEFVRFVPADEHQRGPGWQVIDVRWIAGDGTTILTERRDLGVRTLDDGTAVLDLWCTLTAAGPDVRLDGDPQHAGQQFRALDAFAAPDGPRVRYLRPEGATPRGNDVWTNCAWTAAVLPLPEGPATVLRIEQPTNPPPTWSTRDYGRFGAMCTTTVTAVPLVLRYVYVVALGERDAAWCEAMFRRFVQPTIG